MQTDSYSFFDLFTGTKKYDIPFFQRAYVWQEENWESLLDSMRQDTGQFLGSIILINQADGIDYKLKIIDGQQRLTTLNILFRACYDVICKRKDEVVSAFVKSDCNGSRGAYQRSAGWMV